MSKNIMLNFKKITLDDKKYFQDDKLQDFLLCDYCFTDLYMWQDMYNVELAYDEDTLYLRMMINGKKMYYPPITNDFKKAYNNLKKYCQKENEELVFTCVTEQNKKYLMNSDSFIFEEVFNNEDYIYELEPLQSLKGKKYKQKRNMVNSFLSVYQNRYVIKDISDVSFDEINFFLQKWFLAHDELESKEEEKAIFKAMNNRENLGITGFAIYIDDQLEGFSMGSYFNCEFIVHFEKCNIDIHGLYQFVFYTMCNLVKAKFINREEDLGLSGLRKAKLSYNPIKLEPSYNAFLKSNLQIEIKYAQEANIDVIKKMWNEAFESKEFDEYFFNNIFDIKNVLTYQINEKILGMVQLMFFDDWVYLYGATTALPFRGNMIMEHLIKNILQEYKNVVLIPASEDLFAYYSRFGFIKTSMMKKEKYLKKHDNVTLEIVYEDDLSFILDCYQKRFVNAIPRNIEYYKKIMAYPNLIMLKDQNNYAIVIDNTIVETNTYDNNFLDSILTTLKKDVMDVVFYGVGSPHAMVSSKKNEMYVNLLFEY